MQNRNVSHRVIPPWKCFLTLLLGLTLHDVPITASAADDVKPLDRPNIVFILVDDLRYDGLSCTGSRVARTPSIDRIAGEGAIFRNAFVTTPLCSPARGSFLTGEYVHKHQVRGNGDNNALSHRLVTFPALLQKSGYETAYVGKWHMGNDDSPRPGFDHWVSFKGQGVYTDPAINVDGKLSTVSGYMTDILNDHAVAFLEKPHTKPFLLYLAHKAVHGPFTPAVRHRDLYQGATIPHVPSADDTLEGKPMLRRKVDAPSTKKAFAKKKQGGQPGGGGHNGIALNQLRALASIDEGVGRILKILEQTRQLDKTVIIFTSDNGYLWGEHGLGDKRVAYEESIRIPLLVARRA